MAHVGAVAGGWLLPSGWCWLGHGLSWPGQNRTETIELHPFSPITTEREKNTRAAPQSQHPGRAFPFLVGRRSWVGQIRLGSMFHASMGCARVRAASCGLRASCQELRPGRGSRGGICRSLSRSSGKVPVVHAPDGIPIIPPRPGVLVRPIFSGSVSGKMLDRGRDGVKWLAKSGCEAADTVQVLWSALLSALSSMQCSRCKYTGFLVSCWASPRTIGSLGSRFSEQEGAVPGTLWPRQNEATHDSGVSGMLPSAERCGTCARCA